LPAIHLWALSQKGIVIGRKGAALKKVGTRARARLEEFFQKKCYLETRVKVKPNWRQDEKALQDFGYFD
jgi:GTP-binding protein Era